MKKLISVFALFLCIVALPALSQAAPFTLTQSQLLNFQQLAETPTGMTTLISSDALPGGGVEYTGILGNVPSSGTDYLITIGLNNAIPMDLAGFDSYALNLSNTNNSIWSFQLYLLAGGNIYTSPGYVSVTPGNSTSLSLDFTSISSTDLAAVSAIGFTVMGHNVNTDGYPSDPDIFHVSAAPVPEPGTIVLLGAGLVGVGLYLKRRKA